MKEKVARFWQNGKNIGAQTWSKVKKVPPAQRLIGSYVLGLLVVALTFYITSSRFDIGSRIDITPLDPVGEETEDEYQNRYRDRVLWEFPVGEAAAGKEEQPQEDEEKPAAPTQDFRIILPMEGEMSVTYDHTLWKQQGTVACLHDGVDIKGNPGQPVLAAASGKVVVADTLPLQNDQFGWVVIAHENGYFTIYEGLAAVTVNPDQQVTRGQQLGTLGTLNFCGANNLHFSLYQGGYRSPFYDPESGGGTPLDPLEFTQ